MAEINFNSVYDGITLALHRAFPSVQIHGRTVDQDLHPGDFNVLPVTATHSGQMGTRAQRGPVFDVIYYPIKPGSREEYLEKASVLPGIIGTITTPQGDKIHGTGFEFNFENEDAMHCIVRYPYFVYSPADPDPMETLNIIQEA